MVQHTLRSGSDSKDHFEDIERKKAGDSWGEVAYKKFPYLTKAYNSEDWLVVTHPTTNSPAYGLYAADSRVGVARVRNR
ncbi:hypothetical protein ACN38_g8936 [Penicillium nordicum]|uniref:Uncharacterized protein n=1 Tax=Penicillium nordicum TaxID=229535 RepID=A0A0M8NZ28_9EURO|nr:hypothetical protein ACN38_g8936 [Penicillium nordicum]